MNKNAAVLTTPTMIRTLKPGDMFYNFDGQLETVQTNTALWGSGRYKGDVINGVEYRANTVVRYVVGSGTRGTGCHRNVFREPKPTALSILISELKAHGR